MNKRKAKKRRKQMEQEQEDFLLDFNEFLKALPAIIPKAMECIIDAFNEIATGIGQVGK